MIPTFSKNRSLEKQLFSSLLIGLLCVFSAFWWFSHSAMHTITEDYLLTRLTHDAENIERNLTLKDGTWQLNLEGVSPIYISPNSGHYFMVVTPQQRFDSPSLAAYPLYSKQLEVSKHNGKYEDVYETSGPVEDIILIRWFQTQKNGQTVQIYVAEDYSRIQNMLLKFDVFFGVLTLLSLLSLYFLHKGLLKRAFGQLAPLESQLREFKLGHKIHLIPENYPQEVQALIEGLNLALEQSSLQFEKSRQFNGNLSHSLKTPLNLIFQLIDSPELKRFPVLKKQLEIQSNAILTLIERELKMDRIAHHQSISAIPVDSLWQDLVPTFKQLYRNKAIRFESSIQEGVLLHMEKEDAFELLGNLIDNACKWCKSEVRLGFSGNQLTIEDDGPGVTDEQLQYLQNRGYRTDETKPGHGLGLYIVKGLVSAYQAEIYFEHASLGGLKVVTRFV